MLLAGQRATNSHAKSLWRGGMNSDFEPRLQERKRTLMLSSVASGRTPKQTLVRLEATYFNTRPLSLHNETSPHGKPL